MLIRIDSAGIAPIDPSTQQTWDRDTLAAEQAHRQHIFDSISGSLGIAAIAGPEAAAVGRGAGSIVQLVGALTAPSAPSDASPTLPDPYFAIESTRGGVIQELISPTQPDTATPSWRLSYWLNLDELGGENVRVAVNDRDGDTTLTRIGQVLIPASTLEEVASSLSSQDLVLSDGSLTELLVHVSAPVRASRVQQDVRVPLESGLVSSGIRVPMGALVSIAVTGGGHVTNTDMFSCYGGSVTTTGVPGGLCRDDNRQLFRGSPHGVPIVVIGSPDGTLHGFPLGVSPNLCLAFTAPSAGEMLVGVNDTNLGNNAGTLVFHIEVGPPVAGVRAPTDHAEFCP